MKSFIEDRARPDARWEAKRLKLTERIEIGVPGVGFPFVFQKPVKVYAEIVRICDKSYINV